MYSMQTLLEIEQEKIEDGIMREEILMLGSYFLLEGTLRSDFE